VLEPSETFRPAAVESFFAASSLEQRSPDGRWVPVATPPVLPASDPAGCVSARGEYCWRLNLRDCSPTTGLASLACYRALVAPEARPVVYARHLVQGNRIVLQYWFFYAYNLWSPQFPPNDFFWRTHEGDWEVVTVVLSRGQAPLYVGYSQHCTGKRRTWARVPKWRRTQRPLVYVALGSHGNYFAPGRQPVDLTCWPQAARVIFQVHGVSPADFTGRGPILNPQLVRADTGSPSWMRFRGTWGEQGYFHAPDPVGTVAFGAGPDGPAFHTVWRTPLDVLRRWPPG
jgi:hypothetical protein